MPPVVEIGASGAVVPADIVALRMNGMPAGTPLVFDRVDLDGDGSEYSAPIIEIEVRPDRAG